MKTLISPKDIQRSLRRYGYGGAIDGIIGSRTKNAISDALEQKGFETDDWSPTRELVAYQQMLMRSVGADPGPVDGFVGPQTLFGLEQWQDHLQSHTLTHEDITDPDPKWPREKDVSSFYGSPGRSQTRLHLPYKMKLAWRPNKVVKSFFCHEKVADVMHHCFGEVLKEYGLDRVKELRLDMFGGCLNIRKKRGGSSMSMHSWGIAIDIDPQRNQLRWGADQAQLADPEYNAWWAIWEQYGFVSMGREHNYDWMHLQAARL